MNPPFRGLKSEGLNKKAPRVRRVTVSTKQNLLKEADKILTNNPPPKGYLYPILSNRQMRRRREKEIPCAPIAIQAIVEHSQQ